MKKYELTDEQMKIIRTALERHYYVCKDEGDREEMDAITELEKSLFKQGKEQE